MHVLGLWFYDLFTNISVIYIYWNLEYLLFIFSIIYNLKRHRKIFLLNLIIAFFCYYSHQRAPESSAVSSRFSQLCDFALAQISNEAQNLAHEKLCEITNCVCVYCGDKDQDVEKLTFWQILFRWLCFSGAHGCTTWNSDQHSRVISYICLLLRKWFRL